MNKKEYKEYLKSEHWLNFKNEIYNKYKKCLRCDKRYNLDIHHLTYKRLGYEKESDVILLCRDCHYKIPHKNQQRDFKYIKPSDIINWIIRLFYNEYVLPTQGKRRIRY